MNQPIIKQLEDRKSLIETKVQDLEIDKKTYSRKVSEIQVQIIGLSGELNAIEDILKELKNNV